MSLTTQISGLAVAVGTAVKAIKNTIGLLANLKTVAKGTIVDAINENKDRIDALSSGSAGINDTAASTSSTYSSQKTTDLIAQAKSDLIGGATAVLDTFKEVQDQLAADESAAAALTTAVGNRVRFDAAQTLTSPQMAFARDNIGAIAAALVGDTTIDFAAQFSAAAA